MSAKIRKIAVNIEETHSEIGRKIDPASRKAVAVAVIENPFAGIYQEDLSVLTEIGAELGALLGRKCVEILGITRNKPRAMENPRWSAKTASWNMPPQSCTPN